MVIHLAPSLLALGGLAPAPPSPPAADPFAEAERRSAVAHAAFRHAKGVLDGWWATRDPATGLLPRRVGEPVWSPGDNAADLFPFLVLAARATEPARIPDLLALYSAEAALTTRMGWLPDWYSIAERRFMHVTPDVHRIVFGATEFAKDGLNPLIELDGPALWRPRMAQLLDGVFAVAPIASDFGPLPADGAEVNGELLQTLTRFHFLSGEAKYIEWAERIGDAYCLEVLPRSGGWLPAHHWDFAAHVLRDDRFSLNDHGNEIVGGLAELFQAVTALGRPSRARYEAPLRRMFDTLLERARNADGLWYTLLKPSTAEVLATETPDTWGYALAGCVTFGRAVGDVRYVEAARTALRGVHQDRYLDWGGADSFADSIEGALLLLNRLPEPAGFAWLEQVLPRFWAKQKLAGEGGTGIVEGWYGDGNYARTALMVAFAMTEGASVHPWSEAIRLGGRRAGESLCLSVAAESAWSGVLRLDHPRHRDHYRLPANHPRLNEFPEWFTVEGGALYRVTGAGAPAGERLVSGAALIEGLPLALAAGETRRIAIAPAGDPPFGAERAPADPFQALDASGGDDALVDRIDLAGEEYAGETYRWTARGPIEWTARSVYGPLDCTVWVRWGAKGDVRRGAVTIAGRAMEIERGGHDGFVWIPILVPAEWWDGNDLPIRVEAPPSGIAAFLAAIRVRRLSGAPAPAATARRIEAEELAGSWREQANVPGYSGRGARVSNAAGIAPDSLRVTTDLAPGRYLVWTRGYEGDDQDRSFAVTVGGVLLEPTHRARGGERYDWQLAGAVAIAGPTAIEVRDTGLGYEVADALLLTTDQAFDPGAAERVAGALLADAGGADPLGAAIERCAARAEAAHRAIAGRQDTAPRWKEERARLKERLAGALGLDPPPPRTPLAARTIGTIERDGYRVERVVFESRPGFPVPANVYVPAGVGPFPAVLCPVGHWAHAKAQDVVQARCIGFAKQGFLVLTYDPFGQGERAVEGNGHDEYFRGILAGANNMTYMVWDTVRALDYLLERGDVDGSRIGCTGASGGGLNTLYAAAFDERIAVAAPVVYVTRLREFLETRIGHCPCSHVNGLAAEMDMGDVVALIAPRPVLLVTATQDPSFTPAGARAAAEQARGAYALDHRPDRLAVREFATGHDYDRAMRETVYGWLRLHLLGRGGGEPFPEPPLDLPADANELRCFPGGRPPAATATVRDLSRARAAALLAAAPATAAGTRELLARLLGPAPQTPAHRVAGGGDLAAFARRLGGPVAGEPFVLETQEGDRYPATVRDGSAPDGPFVVLLAEAPLVGLEIGALKSASRVVAFDPRGATGERDLHLLATTAHLDGDSLLARRARGVAAVLQTLRAEVVPDRPCLVLAVGQRPSLILLAAQALGAEAAGIGVSGLPASFLDLFAGEVPAADLGCWRLLAAGEIAALQQATGVPVVSFDKLSAAATITRLAAMVERRR
ncbi:MAG: acetylxylan esterase [Planctomycetota bacterium]